VPALDAAVSGPADKDRTCFRALFTADAQLVPMVKGSDGNLVPKTLTVENWIDRVKKRGSEVFYEKQIKYTSDVYGHIAEIWSTYETRSTPEGKAIDRGINSILAVNDGQAWKVEHILWEPESPAEQVPQKYLPRKHE
jgi:transposase